MKILAIETSCDETAAAVIEDGRKILSNVVASSQDLHKKTGGIIPEIAAREQIKWIIPVLEKAILETFKNGKQEKITSGYRLFTHIDAFAVTIGPGLIGSLLIGVETAKTLAFVTGKPLIPVNHILAHLYANWLRPKILPHNHYHNLYELPKFPAIGLVVSGGHTELFLMETHQKIKWLGGTLDDAAGECFDKTARLLELGFPGGPAIAAASEKFLLSNFKFKINQLPRPMINSSDLNFSFSGLKTAVFREIKRLKEEKKWEETTVYQLAYEIQEAITDVLVKKTFFAAEKYKVKSIILGGGVAANKRLNEKFKLKIKNSKSKINLFIPPPSLCTDNAAYIGSYAYYHYRPLPWQKIQAQPDLKVEV